MSAAGRDHLRQVVADREVGASRVGRGDLELRRRVRRRRQHQRRDCEKPPLHFIPLRACEAQSPSATMASGQSPGAATGGAATAGAGAATAAAAAGVGAGSSRSVWVTAGTRGPVDGDGGTTGATAGLARVIVATTGGCGGSGRDSCAGRGRSGNRRRSGGRDRCTFRQHGHRNRRCGYGRHRWKPPGIVGKERKAGHYEYCRASNQLARMPDVPGTCLVPAKQLIRHQFPLRQLTLVHGGKNRRRSVGSGSGLGGSFARRQASAQPKPWRCPYPTTEPLSIARQDFLIP